MEININLFHQKPMFSFRCKKEDKKRIKKLAKECRMDVDEFIIDASKKYHAIMTHGIPFGFFRKVIDPYTPVNLYVWGDYDKFYNCIKDVDDEYDSYKVKNFTSFIRDEQIIMNITLLQRL